MSRNWLRCRCMPLLTHFLTVYNNGKLSHLATHLPWFWPKRWSKNSIIVLAVVKIKKCGYTRSYVKTEALVETV